MSLQLAAQHLASRGRGPDTMLVHMAPGEVKSLQALARAHGGSLTTNPDTGLPEAGFLESILPLVAGAALGPAGFGLTAMQAALATGAVGTLATGSLRKGLMAGLGAYGGAGLLGSVAGAGESALQAAASSPAASAVAPVVRVAPTAAAVSPVSSAAQLAGTTGTNAVVGATPGFQTLGGETLFSKPAVTPISQIMQTATPTPAVAPVVDRSTYPLMDRLKAGVGAIAEKPGDFFNKQTMRYGLAALAPFMEEEQRGPAYPGSGPNPYQYAFNPGRVANPVRAGGVGQYEYFRPSYTRYAEGGTVQDMSDRNAEETFLANGGQRFADGGNITTPNYIYDPITRTYRDVNAVSPVRTVTRAPVDWRNPLEVNPGPAGDIDNTWGEMSLDQQADFYASHPTYAAITQALQNAFGLTALGQLQKAFVPHYVHANKLSAQGLRPSNYGYNQGLGYFSLGNVVPGQLALAEETPGIFSPPVGGVGLYANPPGGVPGGLGVNPSNTGLGLTSRGADVGNFGYTPGSGVTGAPTGADDEDAALGAAIAAQQAAENAGGYGGISGSDFGYDAGGFGSYAESVAPDSGPGDAGPSSDGGGGVAVDSAVSDGSTWARGGLTALQGAFARGGYNLGDYSDGGRLLKGPGDGVSDSIPASIAGKRPARLADGEFVVPARIVSELGNGSTEAGARKLYAMMDRVQRARGKTVGKGKVAVNSRADKLLPA